MRIQDTAPGSATAERPEIPAIRLPEFVLGRARARGAKPALVEADSGRKISYAGLADAVSGAASWLSAAGVRPGDVVALCAPNGIDFVIAWYAASSAGAVVTTVNPLLTGDELASHFRATDTRWIVTTADLFTGKLADVAVLVPGLAETFILGAGPDPAAGPGEPVGGAGATPVVRRFDALGFASEPVPGAPTTLSGLSPDDVAFLASSSGTTGRPKSVVLTHQNLVANLRLWAGALRVAEGDVLIALAPMFHIYGLQGTLNPGLLSGATIVVLPRFDLAAFLRAIQDHRVTRADVVPPVAVQLAKSQLVDDFDLSSLRLLMSASAPLGLDAARACARRLGVRVVQAFGMTEASGGTHYGLVDGPDRPDSIGPAIPGVACRVVDPVTGAEARPGEPGELVVRSPGVMRGYLNDPAATAAAIDAGGWLHTGDIVTVDADGWYRVTDRLKELIKYKGYQVAPAELEDILLAHPGVADTAVVCSPDEAAGEVPKAFVVRRPGADPVSAAELTAWVAERVAPYKRIRRVEFTDAIPKSAAGKILRRLLVDREYQAAGTMPDLAGTVVVVSGGGGDSEE